MTSKQASWLGIAISAAIVAGVVALILCLIFWSQGIGPPTFATREAILEPINLQIDLTPIASRPAIKTEGDAAAAYRELIGRAEALHDFVDKVQASAEPEKDAVLGPLLELLIKAADMPLPRTTVLDFEDALPLSPVTEWSAKEKLLAVGLLADRAAMSLRADKKPAEAANTLHAGLIWGKRLFQQGAYVPYKSAGIACVTMMLAEFENNYSAKWANDASKAAAAKSLHDTALQVAKQWDAKEHIIRTTNLSPGDLKNLAQHDGDRAWQLEGIMRLGVARWIVDSNDSMASRRVAIERTLQPFTQSKDPLIARRAREALAYTRLDIRSIPVDK